MAFALLLPPSPWVAGNDTPGCEPFGSATLAGSTLELRLAVASSPITRPMAWSMAPAWSSSIRTTEPSRGSDVAVAPYWLGNTPSELDTFFISPPQQALQPAVAEPSNF